MTASRLLFSKQTIPHYYLTVDTCVDKLMGLVLDFAILYFQLIMMFHDFLKRYFWHSLRSQLNSLQESSGGKRISVNDLVIKVYKYTTSCVVLKHLLHMGSDLIPEIVWKHGK